MTASPQVHYKYVIIYQGPRQSSGVVPLCGVKGILEANLLRRLDLTSSLSNVRGLRVLCIGYTPSAITVCFLLKGLRCRSHTQFFQVTANKLRDSEMQ